MPTADMHNSKKWQNEGRPWNKLLTLQHQAMTCKKLQQCLAAERSANYK